MLAAICFPAEDADGSVRIGDVVEALVDGLHGGEGFVVGGAVAPDFALQEFEAIAAQIQKARKIVGAADVHGVRIRGRALGRLNAPGERYCGTTSLALVEAMKRATCKPMRLAKIPAVRLPKFPLGTETISVTEATGSWR